MFRVGGAEPKVGAVSRAQLLATNIVERLHDAVYVIPRAVDTPPEERPSLNLKEYAVDIAYSVRELAKVSDEFPRLTEASFAAALAAVAADERRVDDELRTLLVEATALRDCLDSTRYICCVRFVLCLCVCVSKCTKRNISKYSSR